jgi:hypothetical protein
MLLSGTRTSKNVGGGLDEKIKLSDVLVKRRKALLDQATISTEITAFQILHQERPAYATGNYRQSIARQLTISSYLSEVLLPHNPILLSPDTQLMVGLTAR